ncbi:hypothetical protein MKX03_020772, partial [Papaver bracteatum]
ENIGHQKGSFLLQYDEQEMRLVDPINEVDIVVEDYFEPEVPVGDTENKVPVGDTENEVTAPIEENI